MEVVELLPEKEEEARGAALALTREVLLSRLRIHFHYCSGETGVPIAALPLHTDRSAFDKQSGGFTSPEEVTATLRQAQEQAQEQGGGSSKVGEGSLLQQQSQIQGQGQSAVVTSVSYTEFEQLYAALVAGGGGLDDEAQRSTDSQGGASGFI